MKRRIQNEIMKTIAVIPAYMEENTIGNIAENAKTHVSQVIVIDDGSTDNTSTNAKAAGAIVIRHRKNKGYGGAIKSAFYAARKYNADAMVILDADKQHDPGEIPVLLDSLYKKNYDVVVGSRFLDSRNGKNIPFYRKIGMKFLDLFTNTFAKGDFDTQSGFRAYSRKAIQLIEPDENGMGVGSEVLIKAKKLSLSIGQVPITVNYDTRKPLRNPLMHGGTVIMTLVKIVAEKHPLVFFGVTGFVLLTGGMVTGSLVINRYNALHELPVGFALITLLFSIVGIFMITSALTLYAIQDSIKRTLQDRELERREMELAMENIETKY